MVTVGIGDTGTSRPSRLASWEDGGRDGVDAVGRSKQSSGESDMAEGDV